MKNEAHEELRTFVRMLFEEDGDAAYCIFKPPIFIQFQVDRDTWGNEADGAMEAHVVV